MSPIRVPGGSILINPNSNFQLASFTSQVMGQPSSNNKPNQICQHQGAGQAQAPHRGRAKPKPTSGALLVPPEGSTTALPIFKSDGPPWLNLSSSFDTSISSAGLDDEQPIADMKWAAAGTPTAGGVSDSETLFQILLGGLY
ncbi:hypothetical protein Leryth_020236 [Lithospermum erythrorhizon]|nr:hypothetical protein Leryth_020236 [Lithospermum erythrorhizon]